MQKQKFLLPIISSIIMATVVMTGCSQNITPSAPGTKTQPESVAQANTSEIVELKDGDNYDLAVEYVNQEINGQSYKMLAYNGSIPGPTLKVSQTAEITINLKNNTDIPTSLHSHGVRLEDKFDGIVDLQQPAIQPGQTFIYKIKFPDAGMFWYHPHLYASFTQSHGLYGNYWVIPKNQDYWPSVNEEIPLMLNDILIENGQLDSFRGKLSNYTLMGKFGNVMLVNGSTNYQQTFQQAEVVRFYLTNASNTRTYNLTIPNIKMKLVGGDNGKHERETWQDSIILAPSERAIVEVMFDQAGTFILQNVNPQKTYTLATFTVSDAKTAQDFSQEFATLRQNQDVITDIDAFRPYFDKAPDKSITFALDMSGMGDMGGHMMSGGDMMSQDGMMGEQEMMMGDTASQDDDHKIEWEDSMPMMNEMSNTDLVKWKIVDDSTQKTGMDIDWKFKVGDKVKIKIFNDPEAVHPMQHPLHLHGQRFLVLNTNGIKNTNLVWKDTVLIPEGDTVEILVDMSNPGKWMGHCHIAEHLESGMMFSYEVK